MSSIGVVVFRNPLTQTQVLQESVNNSMNISNNDGNKVQRREIVIVKKKQKTQSPPATVSVTSLVRAAESGISAKRPRLRDESADEAPKTPTPLAVARRNARERNRVRQVNDGFAALRRHIPDEVAEAFESANSNRGPNKKLSKVETLRMAVEYIRNLESLLNIGHASDKENSSRPSMESFPSPASSSPRDNSFERNYFLINSPALEDDDIDDDLDDTLPHMPHYATLPAAECFQMVSTPHLYEDEDRGQSLTPSSDMLTHEDVGINAQILEDGFPFPNSAEQFTVINTDNNYNCVDSDLTLIDSTTQYEVKYADSLRAQINYDESGQMPLESINPGIMLPCEQFKLKEEQSAVDNESYDIDYKKELPDINVTPEDRQQFEETLKWWQEKTKQSRPYLKANNN